jgi:PilZ domain
MIEGNQAYLDVLIAQYVMGPKRDAHFRNLHSGPCNCFEGLNFPNLMDFHGYLNLGVRAMRERRLQPRVSDSRMGKITLDDGTIIECVLVNRSASGACIEVDSPTRVAGSFTLTVAPSDFKHDCQVAWRLGKRLGITFLISPSKVVQGQI